MTMVADNQLVTTEVFEVRSTLVNIRSFSIPWNASASFAPEFSFSPTTCHLSVSGGNDLRVFRGWNRDCLLEAMGNYNCHYFSLDGSFFAALDRDSIHIWKYSSGHYTLWKEFPSRTSTFFQFSPTLSSILGNFRDLLLVWRMDDLPIPRKTRQQYAGLPRSGNHIVTAHKSETSVTIIHPHSQAPSQFVDTDMEIDWLVLTGNVLLVAGSDVLVAWLLTEEGLVDGVFGGRRAGRGDSIWDIPLPDQYNPIFMVEGRVAAIKFFRLEDENEDADWSYHTGTGESLPIPQRLSRLEDFSQVLTGNGSLRYHNLLQSKTPPDGGWKASMGWMKDPEGRCRLWVPVEWSDAWNFHDWRHDIMTQFMCVGQNPVIVKF
jgi:hypothetical protein